MRWLTLVLALLVPTVATAQTSAQAAVPLTEQAPLDVLPPVADDEFPWMGIAAYGLVLGFIIFLGVAGEDLGIGLCEGSLIAVGVGFVAWLLTGGVGEANCTAPPPEAVAQYSMEGLAAFAANNLTDDQRAQMAEVAQDRGREGVVLQRLVETRAGVGEAPGEIVLEVAVLDAETAQFRPVADDLLAPQTVLSLPVGFVGRALVPQLAERHSVVALGRGVTEEPQKAESPLEPGVVWRRWDLFSLFETERALEGVEVAYYLVHSMMPSSRLTQGRFQDLDLLLADNFARAARKVGVKRIIYLGGLVSEEEALSPHLASRLEVERALGAYGVPVTAVRAGLVVGPGGSSMEILVRLVARLPAMVCPRWTGSRSQPIALDDAVTLLGACLELEETSGRVCEIGGPDVLSYREMMQETARVMGKRRVMVPFPLVTPGLSRLWVSLVTRAPRALVAPLIQSLRHRMVADDPWLQKKLGLRGKPFAVALAESLRTESLTRQPTALSVQRLPLPEGRDAIWLAAEYAAWLPVALRGLIRVARHDAGLDFYAVGLPWPLLSLSFRADRSGPDRALFEVSGGLLAGRSEGFPRLEFRTMPDGDAALAAVHQFSPRLPWWVYTQTQARVHAWVMWRFRRYLRRLAAGRRSLAATPTQERNDAVLAALDDERPGVRLEAIRVLSPPKSSLVLSRFERMLDTASPSERIAIIQGIAKSKLPGADMLLMELVTHGKREVRAAAVATVDQDGYGY